MLSYTSRCPNTGTVRSPLLRMRTPQQTTVSAIRTPRLPSIHATPSAVGRRSQKNGMPPRPPARFHDCILTLQSNSPEKTHALRASPARSLGTITASRLRTATMASCRPPIFVLSAPHDVSVGQNRCQKTDDRGSAVLFLPAGSLRAAAPRSRPSSLAASREPV